MRLEGDGFTLRAELRADVASFKSDTKSISRRLGDLPLALHGVWVDFCSDWKEIQADAATEVRIATRRLASLVKTNS
jgi:hypothetical protein